MKIGPDFQEEHVLADGTIVVLRAIRPSDRAELARGFNRLSPSSRARRFLGGPAELSEETLRYLTDVDFVDHVALVAGTTSPDLITETGLGVARFVRLEPELAEAAVTVVDEAQRKGIAKLLVTSLAIAAVERGIRAFRAEVAAENEAVRALLAEAGAIERHRFEDTIVFDVPIAEPDHDLRVVDRVLRAAAETMAIVSRMVRIVRSSPTPAGDPPAAPSDP